jgi:hypothetical protein
MRVRELIAQNAIPWPPSVVSAVGPSETVPLAGEVRQAILESVFWAQDDSDTRWWIDLRLQLPGGMATASLVSARWQKQVYQDLFWALQRGLGQTLAAIEDFEVAP